MKNATEIYQEMQSGDYESFRTKLKKALPDVGSRDLNDEHMGLLSIFFSFQRTMEDFRQKIPNGTDWEKVAFDLETLIDFTENHLRKEEELMERVGHKNLVAHRAEHNIFRRKLKGYQEAIKTRETQDILKLKYDMFDWFVQHIGVTDVKYKEDIQKG